MQDRAERFNNAVEAFLKTKNKDIGSLTEKELEGFLGDPAISAYLTRSANDVAFDAKGEPVFESAYEASYYERLRKSLTPTDTSEDIQRKSIPYRAHACYHIRNIIDGTSQPFYDSGTTEEAKAILDRMLQKHLDEYNQYDSGKSHHVFLVTNPPDVYQISGLLRNFQGEKAKYDNMAGIMKDGFGKQIQLPKDGISYLIIPSGRDAHAITFFAVLDNTAKKVIRTGLCNSWQNDSYAKQVCTRMNMDVPCAEELEYDQEKGTNHYPKVDPFSFVDCSHHIQLSATDLNCGLYRYHFARALIDMIEHEPDIRKILSDSKATDEHVAARVKEGMKAHLPEYYHRNSGSFTEASEEEKRQVHLQTRWETGNAFLREKIRELSQQNGGRRRVNEGGESKLKQADNS